MTTGTFPEIYSDKIIPCPAWTGTYNASLYQSVNDAVPAMRGGYKRSDHKRGGYKRSMQKRSVQKRGGYKKYGRTKKRYGGFVPRPQNPRPKKVGRRTKRGGPTPNMRPTPVYSTHPTSNR